MTDFAELERLAREATPLQWERDHEGWVQDCDKWEAQDYIAACSPDQVLRLVAIARAAENYVQHGANGGVKEEAVSFAALRAALSPEKETSAARTPEAR